MAGRVKLNRQLPPKADPQKGSINLDNENPSNPNLELGAHNMHSEFNSRKNVASQGNFGSYPNIGDGGLGSMKVGSNANFEDEDEEDVDQEQDIRQTYNLPRIEEEGSSVPQRPLQRMAPVQAGEFHEKQVFKWMIIWLIIQQMFNVAILGVTSASFDMIVDFDEASYSQLEEVVMTAFSCGTEYKAYSNINDCGSSDNYITMGKFKGTRQGCFCSGEIYATDSCSSDCSVVDSISETKLYFWKEIAICGDKSEISYSTNCGNDGLYSFTENFFMCIPDFVSTVTDIDIFVDTSTVTVPTDYDSFMVFTSVDNVILYYATSNTRNVFTGFEITYGKPCLARNYYHRRSTYNSPHPLELQTLDGCGRYGYDPGAVLIDSHTEKELLEDNNITYGAVPGLVQYITDQKVYLYAIYAPKMRGSASSYCYVNNEDLCATITGGDFDAYRQFGITNQWVNFFIALSLCVLYFGQMGILFWKKNYNFEKYFFQKVIVYSTWCFGIFFLCQFAFSYLFYDYGTTTTQLKKIAEGNCYANEKINLALIDFHSLMSTLNEIYIYTIVNFSLRAGLVLFVSIINCTMKDLQFSATNKPTPRGHRH